MTASTKTAGKASPIHDPVAKEDTLAISTATTKKEKRNKKGTRPPRQLVQETTGLKEKETKRKRGKGKERDRKSQSQNPKVPIRSITKTKTSERNIYDAAQRGDIKTIKRELDGGVHPDAFRLPSSRTTLDHSFGYIKGTTALITASFHGRIEIVRMLINHGADVNSRDDRRRTSLMRAARNGREEVVRLLLSAEADLEARDDSGNTAFLLAAMYGETAVLTRLLEAGADGGALDNRGRNALMLAASNAHVPAIRFLLLTVVWDGIIERNATDISGISAYHAALLSNKPNRTTSAAAMLHQAGALFTERMKSDPKLSERGFAVRVMDDIVNRQSPELLEQPSIQRLISHQRLKNPLPSESLRMRSLRMWRLSGSDTSYSIRIRRNASLLNELHRLSFTRHRQTIDDVINQRAFLQFLAGAHGKDSSRLLWKLNGCSNSLKRMIADFLGIKLDSSLPTRRTVLQSRMVRQENSAAALMLSGSRDVPHFLRQRVMGKLQEKQPMSHKESLRWHRSLMGDDHCLWGHGQSAAAPCHWTHSGWICDDQDQGPEVCCICHEPIQTVQLADLRAFRQALKGTAIGKSPLLSLLSPCVMRLVGSFLDLPSSSACRRGDGVRYNGNTQTWEDMVHQPQPFHHQDLSFDQHHPHIHYLSPCPEGACHRSCLKGWLECKTKFQATVFHPDESAPAQHASRARHASRHTAGAWGVDLIDTRPHWGIMRRTKIFVPGRRGPDLPDWD